METDMYIYIYVFKYSYTYVNIYTYIYAWILLTSHIDRCFNLSNLTHEHMQVADKPLIPSRKLRMLLALQDLGRFSRCSSPGGGAGVEEVGPWIEQPACGNAEPENRVAFR
jgi:hypothetical protein